MPDGHPDRRAGIYRGRGRVLTAEAAQSFATPMPSPREQLGLRFWNLVARIFATSYNVTQALGGHAVREYQAIIIAGLITGVIGGAWMWINRYEIKPHDSGSFRLRD